MLNTAEKLRKNPWIRTSVVLQVDFCLFALNSVCACGKVRNRMINAVCKPWVTHTKMGLCECAEPSKQNLYIQKGNVRKLSRNVRKLSCHVSQPLPRVCLHQQWGQTLLSAKGQLASASSAAALCNFCVTELGEALGEVFTVPILVLQSTKPLYFKGLVWGGGRVISSGHFIIKPPGRSLPGLEYWQPICPDICIHTWK